MKSNYFKKPFSIVGPYVKDANRNVCFTIVCDDNLANKIVDKINGRIHDKFKTRVKMDNVLINDVIVLKVKGWGYLHGLCKLPSKIAIDEQNKLLEYVVTKLNE